MIVQTPYPNAVCRQCGLATNVLSCLIKYGELPLKNAYDVSTMHEGICDVCGRRTAVTEPRDYFWPEFTLLNKQRWSKALEGKHYAKNNVWIAGD